MGLYERHAELLSLREEIGRAAEAVVAAYKAGKKILLCGNGGSAADCEHISGELIKEFKIRRPIDPALREALERAGRADMADKLAGGICSVSLLSQSAVFTALCNDVGYEYAFAQQVCAMGAPGDVLFAFSTSGNSKAVVNAAVTARACGMTVVGFTGQGGGMLLPHCDIRINVPETETYLVQELHLPVYHEICALAEEKIWGGLPMIVAGLDIGGTKCAALLADAREDKIEFLEREQIETKGTWESVLDALCKKIKVFAARRGATAEAVGISCGGPLSSARGAILSPPNLPGWDNVPACAYVAERLGLEEKAVRLKNDADACAVAEWKYGAGRGTRNMIFLTFGTGLGAGLILNGALYSGTDDMAGEAGHIRLEKLGPVGYGKAGSFEGFCSGGGIAQLTDMYFTEKIQRGEKCPYYRGAGSVSAKVLGERAAQGDADALAVFGLVGKYFGRGLSVLVDLLNPEVIVAGSIYARCRQYIEPNMQREMQKECLAASYARVRVLPSKLGEKIGDYGAVVAALV